MFITVVIIAVITLSVVVYLYYQMTKKVELGNRIDRVVGTYLSLGGETALFKHIRKVTTGQIDHLGLPSITPHNYLLYTLFPSLWLHAHHEREVVKALPAITSELDTHTDSSFTEDVSGDIVIHVRCGDVPFIRYPGYHVYRYAGYVRAIEALLAKQSFKRVTIIYSTSHMGNPYRAKASNAMVEGLIEYLRAHIQLPVHAISGRSLGRDLAHMRRAGALIGLVGSLIWYVGLSKSTGYFVTSGTPILDHMIRLPDIEQYKVKHRDVPNYFDIPDLLDRLRS